MALNYSVDDAVHRMNIGDIIPIDMLPLVTVIPENETNITACKNDYCISEEEYVDMLEEYAFPKPFEWIFIAFYALIFIIGVSGNFLVCFAVWRNQSMRTVTNYFIVNLAVADLLVLLICLPPTVTTNVTETWYFGNISCKIIHYLQGVSVSVSILTLSAIAIERWYAICRPLNLMSSTTSSRTRLLILLIWIIALTLMVPELLVLEQKLFKNEYILLSSCKPNMELYYWSAGSQMAYELFKMISLYLMPLGLIGITYGLIMKTLWSTSLATGTSRQPTLRFEGRLNSEAQLISRRKAAKMLIVVVIVFAVSYLPVHLLNILRYAKRLPDSTYFAMIAHFLCYISSTVNPVIYNFMSEKFQDAFKKSLRRPLCCQQRRQSAFV